MKFGDKCPDCGTELSRKDWCLCGWCDVPMPIDIALWKACETIMKPGFRTIIMEAV